MADPFVAEIRIFPFNFAPRGWAACDGQLLPISQNTALFSLLGTTYGGDGRSTFALPNLLGWHCRPLLSHLQHAYEGAFRI
jgi:microcystin-dependent protein